MRFSGPGDGGFFFWCSCPSGTRFFRPRCGGLEGRIDGGKPLGPAPGGGGVGDFCLWAAGVVLPWPMSGGSRFVPACLASVTLLIIGLQALLEHPVNLAAMVMPMVRRGWWGRLAGRFLYPGWPSGVNFVFFLLLAAGVFMFWRFHGQFPLRYGWSGPLSRIPMIGRWWSPVGVPSPGCCRFRWCSGRFVSGSACHGTWVFTFCYYLWWQRWRLP